MQHNVKTNANLPPQFTSFVGREDEIGKISQLLADPDCRLLTLLGPGGIGKTRLALQATAVAAPAFPDGTLFVNLQPAQSPMVLISAIADAIGLPLSAQTTPDVQLQNYLHDKKLLLVLDDFEHLLGEPYRPDGADLLSPILYNAPGIKCLVTSREVLNLQEEWQFPVDGLTFPTRENVVGWQNFSAVQLFIERAKQVRPSFNENLEESSIRHICRLVDGTPLALELAASWTKTLSCQAIAAEIRQNIAFLETNLRNIPERHRSMRAVFDQAWQQLSEPEQHVFKRLSVFRDGFLPEAAQQVAAASLPILSALVDKSLLRWEPKGKDGRYQMHELLRQYAEEQLIDSPEDASQTLDSHSEYYCHFLHEHEVDLQGSRQAEAMLVIHAELENVRVAWAYAVLNGRVSDLRKAVYTYQVFSDFQSRFREGADGLLAAKQKLATLPASEEVLLAQAEVDTYLAWTYLRLGRLNEAQQLFEAGQATHEKLNIPPQTGFSRDPLTGLALVANVKGDYDAALAYCERARQLAESRHDTGSFQVIWYVWADVLLSTGDYDEAWQVALKGQAACQQTGNQWMLANLLIVMGNIALAQNDFDLAEQQFRASYEIKDHMNDPEGMALAVNYLAQVALRQKHYDQAQQLYQQCLAIYREIYDLGGLVRSLQGAGDTAVALNEWQTAVANYREALQIADTMQWEPLVLSLFISVAQLLHSAGEPERSAEIAAYVNDHAAEQEAKDRAVLLLKRTRQKPVAPKTDLPLITKQVLEELDTRPFMAATMPEHEAPINQPLIDPLTPRELEVLNLIADGMSNRAIAEHLIISVGTVKSYTSIIYSKLGVSSRTQAVAEARELGIVS